MGLTPISGEIQAQPLNDNFSYLDHKFKDLFINVKDYGAKGDGVTDDTSAIQNAINEANINGGGDVFVPKTNSHYIASTVSVKDNIRLLSNGAEIKLKNSSNTNLISIDGSNVIVEGLEVDGNKDNQTSTTINGIVINGGSFRDIMIKRNIIRNVKQDGIYINGTNVKAIENFVFDCDRLGISAGDNVKDIQITNNYVNGTGKSGITVVGFGTGISITNNLTDNTGEDGVTGYNNNNVDFLIANNVIRNASNNGTHIAGENISVINNIYDNIAFHAIYVQGASLEANEGVNVLGNQVYNAQGAHPIMINNYTKFSVSENIIDSSNVGTFIGVYLLGCKKGSVANNIVTKNGSDAIRLDNTTDVTINSNTLEDNAGNGVRAVNTCTDITITGNVIRNNGVWGIITQDTSDNIVCIGNVVRDNTSGQISLVGTNNINANNLTT